MSSINGTYVNANAGAKLTITDGNDSNGTFSGTFSQAALTMTSATGITISRTAPDNLPPSRLSV